MSTTAGTSAARAWLAARALSAPALARWHADVVLGIGDHAPAANVDETAGTGFRLEIYAEEWGFLFSHAGRTSWVRVTDIPFVHGRDDFQLLGVAPALEDIGQLLRGLEHRYKLAFRRDLALVRTDLAHAEAAIRHWVQSL